MHTVQSLIDEAIKLCGSQAELARRIGMQRQDIYNMAKGDRPITPETVALLCDVLELSGAEAREIAAWAVILNAKNAEKRERLKRAFFGAWVSGVVAICLQAGPTDAKAATNSPTLSTVVVDRVCILCKIVDG